MLKTDTKMNSDVNNLNTRDIKKRLSVIEDKAKSGFGQVDEIDNLLKF